MKISSTDVHQPLRCFKNSHKFILGFLMLTPLAGCDFSRGFIPAVESTWYSVFSATQHTVVKGDTLFSIAFRYDVDYRKIIVLNHLKPPYRLRVGQVLYFSSTPDLGRKNVQVRHMAPPSRQRFAPYQPVQRTIWVHSSNQSNWQWPARGSLVTQFSPQNGAKGVNIAGKRGDPVYAASNGVVAYEGNGLKGYGNLIIIRHGNQYLTAYGHNLKNKVRVGNYVKKGQVIAEMGTIDRKYWGVHFEIRRSGKPINPLQFLNGNSK